ncbi:unnamed protein product, partial [Symbiodinium sp. KB8]
ELVRDLGELASKEKICPKAWNKIRGRLDFVDRVEVSNFLHQVQDYVFESRPRTLRVHTPETLYLFTDASQEGVGGQDMGLDAVLLNQEGCVMAWFGVFASAFRGQKVSIDSGYLRKRTWHLQSVKLAKRGNIPFEDRGWPIKNVSSSSCIAAGIMALVWHSDGGRNIAPGDLALEDRGAAYVLTFDVQRRDLSSVDLHAGICGLLGDPSRTPVPEPLLLSMVTLAWMKGYKRWCGCTLLAFYGMARVGEVLACRRRHLLLREDLFLFCPAVFLRLDSSKTSLHGRPKVQHIRVDDTRAMALIQSAFADLEPDERLYPFSPSAFRTRWDRSLQTLGLQDMVSVTPGGLRGGGAVAAYHRGCPIADIQWRWPP